MKKNSIKRQLFPFFKVFFLTSIIILTSCAKEGSSENRRVPTNALERARQNVEEGRGVSVGSILGGRRSTNFEFSSSNPMWRASLEILDFLPLSVVDYSGGMLITDWYTDEENSRNSLKISLRFLSNEIRSDSLKIIIHEKKCTAAANCSIKLLNSKIREELLTSIIKKAALLEKENKKK
jgi:hypothetical protein